MSESLNLALAEQAAPVLLGCKRGALFTVAFQDARELYALLHSQSSHLCTEILRRQGERLLVLFYNRQMLEDTLREQEVQQILSELGYPREMKQALLFLKKRICMQPEFPHEVGLFLGYPAEDAAGFVRHGGEHCKLCGTWKVYGDVERAQSRFAMYESCRSLLTQYVNRGGDLLRLCVNQQREHVS